MLVQLMINKIQDNIAMNSVSYFLPYLSPSPRLIAYLVKRSNRNGVISRR